MGDAVKIAEPIVTALGKAFGEFREALGLELVEHEQRTAATIDEMGRDLRDVKQTAVAALRPRSAPRPVHPRTQIIRAAVAILKGHAFNTDAATLAEKLYTSSTADVVRDFPGFIAKAQTNPAMTSVNGWAAELVGPANLSPLALLAPASTYAALQARGLSLNFNGFGAARLPARSGSGDLAGDFIAEGAGIPVKKAALTSGSISPHKFGVISTFTREMANYSTPAFEAVVRDLITSDATTAIDTALLGSAAGSTVRPPGLLNGLTSLAPTAGGGVAAIAGDLGNLAAAIPNAVDLVFLMAEATRVRALALCPGLAGVTIISAPQVPATRVIAIDAADFASAEADPSFEASEEATIVSDTGMPVPDMMSAGTTSLFQQGLIGIRFLESATWAMRQTGRVAFVDPISW